MTVFGTRGQPIRRSCYRRDAAHSRAEAVRSVGAGRRRFVAGIAIGRAAVVIAGTGTIRGTIFILRQSIMDGRAGRTGRAISFASAANSFRSAI